MAISAALAAWHDILERVNRWRLGARYGSATFGNHVLPPVKKALIAFDLGETSQRQRRPSEGPRLRRLQ